MRPIRDERVCTGLQSALFVAVAMAALLLFAFITSGCGTTGKVQMTTAASVDTAMQGWAQWVVAGKATPEQEAQVRQLHKLYLVAAEAADEALLAWSNTGDRAPLEQAHQALLAAQQHLITLIKELSQ